MKLKHLIAILNDNSLSDKRNSRIHVFKTAMIIRVSLIMLSIDFEPNFSVYQSIGLIDLPLSQIQEFCHLF